MTQIGSTNHNSKLTEEMVKAIRRTWTQNRYPCAHCGRAKGITQTDLARRYGVSVKTIAGIVRKETWKHVSLTRPDATV